MSLPLEGIRVLDLSRLLPGPFATQILADFGADVIKIEDTRTGDGFRHAEPKINGMATRHMSLNRNKRCLSVDLKNPRGRNMLLRLTREADVVLEGFRPGVMKRLGLDYDAMRAINPRIVYCSLSGFGQESPLRELAAHDPNYLALAGVLSLIGKRGGSPALSGLQMADITAALFTTIGILIAVRRAECAGVGEYLDIALHDSVMATAVTAASTYFGTGQAPSRGEERHSGRYPFADIFETADGRHITVCAIEAHFWRNLCHALGHVEWIDEQYAEGARADEIREEMASIFLTRSRDDWFKQLGALDTCVAPVLNLGEALGSEQARQRGLVMDSLHPLAGPVSMLASPIRMRNTPVEIRRPAGRLGEDAAEILRGLGYDNAEIAALRDSGVIAMPADKDN